MLDSNLFVIINAIICLVIGYVVVHFKFYSITYFIKGRIIRDSEFSGVKNVHLRNIKKRYGLVLSVIPILGFSWGLFGIILSCAIVLNSFNFFIVNNTAVLLFVIDSWIVINILILTVIPVIFLLTKATLPDGMKRSFTKKFFIFLIVLILSSAVYSYFIIKISHEGLLILLLLGFPSVLSAWYIGQYFGLFIIRSWYQLTGYDFIINHKMSFFGRLKGFFSLVFAIITPILAINSILAVLFKNTDKGGFIGISLSNLINLDINWQFSFVKPSFEILASVIIVFLIVGPLVTFIFRPTNIFELTLNSNIYTTLSNYNRDYFEEYANDTIDGIIFDALTENEMIGILLLFVSFICYIALLSVAALTSSFNIPIIQSFGLAELNGTIKLVEIPVLFFIEFVMLHDLSEERQVMKLASLSKKNNIQHPKIVPIQ